MGRRGDARVVLPAKLLRPDPRGVVRRPRLFRVLSRRGGASVVWVHAPAGAGKTVLVASFLESRPSPALWYEVDASDADVSGFFHYLRLAAEHLVQRPLDLPVHQANSLVGLEGVARRYFTLLFAELPPGVRLVFDNYQAASAHADWNLVFRELVSAHPRGTKVFVTSRYAPPTGLARFRASETR